MARASLFIVFLLSVILLVSGWAGPNSHKFRHPHLRGDVKVSPSGAGLNPDQPTPFSLEHMNETILRHSRGLNGRAPPPSGLKYFNPLQLKPNYGLSSTASGGYGKTIAIVEPWGHSTAENDLIVFSSAFGLPYPDSTLFQYVNQSGGTKYPPNDFTGPWPIHTSLALQSAHAFAPEAKKILVACNSDLLDDMMKGVQWAIAHADYVVMSWGIAEGDWVPYYEPLFQAGSATTSYFAATGDFGGGSVLYPATSLYVVAVGSTSLWTYPDYSFEHEEGYLWSGGGCSVWTPANGQVYESGYNWDCNGFKSIPDMAMVGDPRSGFIIQLTQSGAHGTCSPPNCYYAAGGTALSVGLAAARAAARMYNGRVTPDDVYVSGYITYRDITVGNNGMYYTQTGYDQVTGMGSWYGI